MIRPIILSLIFIFSFSALNAQKRKKSCKKKKAKTTAVAKNLTTTSTEQKDSNIFTFTLKEGETQFFSNLKMNITFKNVAEDSRCPEGTQCIWAGVGVAEITFMGLYTRPATFKIATTDLPDKNLHNKVQFLGHEFTLEKLSPNPIAEKDFEALKGNYTITLYTPKSDKIPTKKTTNPRSTTTK